MSLLEIKRDLNKSALALLLYVLSVQILAVLLVLLLPLTKIPLLSDQYICMVISVVISYCLLNNIFPKETSAESTKEISTEPNPEKPSFSVLSFLHYFMLFQAAQWIGGIINIPIMTLFTKLGLNLSFSEEAARGGSLTNAPMLFYTILVAPLMEELVFRGIFYRRFRSYGKYFAAFYTAFFFALMHSNFLQFAPAFSMGMILFFIRDRYGLPYSILLHFSNNLLAIVVNNLSQDSTLIQGIYGGFLLAGMFYGIYFVLKNRTHFAEDYQYEKEHSLSLKQFFSSPLLWVDIVLMVALACVSLFVPMDAGAM
ncbi:CPBP family intramembrane glutamic endopeptidase [Oribacterium sinus]|uniref:CPBP family intramembrane metalloprotease n=1 Tax=Oribacterium sinus TaxID=237576 RepID=A0A930DKH9_9FIRM|nr:CPBP family intramembrane metalloprotease [Oribacterium sinus]MBF1272480.1 CPBP family intramembrane metalloprotease [Oribacterium sinus]